MGYRIEGDFDGPLLPELPNAMATCKEKRCIWIRFDLYQEIKKKVLSHCKNNPGHIVHVQPDNQPAYDQVWEKKQETGDKPPF